jgi:hypothetical protein
MPSSPELRDALSISTAIPRRQTWSCPINTLAAAQAAPLQRTLGFPFCADLAPLKVDPADADMRAPRLSWNSGATVR